MKTKAHIRYKTAAGRQVPGVTTITGLKAKPFLVGWANRLGLQGIDSTRYRDKMANVGTLTHYLVECDLKGEKPDLSDYSQNDIKLAKVAYSKWEEWKQGKTIEPIALEIPLVSEKYGYGGTLDIYANVDGKANLIDLKTSKAIYDDNAYQLAAYRQLLSEHDHPVNKVRLLRIGRSQSEGFEERMYPRLDVQWRIFKALLTVYYEEKKLR
ncbi:MAG: hypothetical protein ACE5E0_02940 [Terriglobia bacterium]